MGWPPPPPLASACPDRTTNFNSILRPSRIGKNMHQNLWSPGAGDLKGWGEAQGLGLDSGQGLQKRHDEGVAQGEEEESKSESSAIPSWAWTFSFCPPSPPMSPERGGAGEGLAEGNVRLYNTYPLPVASRGPHRGWGVGGRRPTTSRHIPHPSPEAFADYVVPGTSSWVWAGGRGSGGRDHGGRGGEEEVDVPDVEVLRLEKSTDLIEGEVPNSGHHCHDRPSTPSSSPPSPSPCLSPPPPPGLIDTSAPLLVAADAGGHVRKGWGQKKGGDGDGAALWIEAADDGHPIAPSGKRCLDEQRAESGEIWDTVVGIASMGNEGAAVDEGEILKRGVDLWSGGWKEIPKLGEEVGRRQLGEAGSASEGSQECNIWEGIGSGGAGSSLQAVRGEWEWWPRSSQCDVLCGGQVELDKPNGRSCSSCYVPVRAPVPTTTNGTKVSAPFQVESMRAACQQGRGRMNRLGGPSPAGVGARIGPSGGPGRGRGPGLVMELERGNKQGSGLSLDLRPGLGVGSGPALGHADYGCTGHSKEWKREKEERLVIGQLEGPTQWEGFGLDLQEGFMEKLREQGMHPEEGKDQEWRRELGRKLLYMALTL